MVARHLTPWACLTLSPTAAPGNPAPRLISGIGETGLLFLRVTMSQGRISLADVQPNFRKDFNTYFLHQDKVSFSNRMN